MSDLLPQREHEALADLKSWTDYFYTYKQASMRKLEARGLVRSVGMRGKQTIWALTEEGKRHV